MPIAPEKAFTQNWLQSLTLVVENPAARMIKPLFNAVDDICRVATDADRAQAARQLWQYAQPAGLTNMLAIVPAQQAVWHLDPSETFAFERVDVDPLDQVDRWMQAIGVQPGKFALNARVVSSDWSTLVRREAVRLKKTFNAGSVPVGHTLTMPVTANWDGARWTITFDNVDWISISYEEPFKVRRPAITELEETITWCIAAAQESMIPKPTPPCTVSSELPLWLGCVSRFESLHRQVLTTTGPTAYAPWFRRVWACVWPIVYREQNCLKGLAELDAVRQELVACMHTVPQLTVWLFVFAKLLCQAQLSWGLGICGNYQDDL